MRNLVGEKLISKLSMCLSLKMEFFFKIKFCNKIICFYNSGQGQLTHEAMDTSLDLSTSRVATSALLLPSINNTMTPRELGPAGLPFQAAGPSFNASSQTLSTPSVQAESQSSDVAMATDSLVAMATQGRSLPLLQQTLSGSSSDFTEYSVTGESPVRPGSRPMSQQSSVGLENRGTMSVGLSLSDSSSQASAAVTGTDSSLPDLGSSHSASATESSMDIGSLDLTRAEARSLDLSSGSRSQETASSLDVAPSFDTLTPVTSSGQGHSQQGQGQGSGSLESDGSLDLTKSAAALTTLQPVVPVTNAASSSKYVLLNTFIVDKIR